MQLYRTKREHAGGEDHLPSSATAKTSSPQTTAPDRPREVAQLKQARYLRFTHKAYNK
jgi:hypothetical protein